MKAKSLPKCLYCGTEIEIIKTGTGKFAWICGAANCVGRFFAYKVFDYRRTCVVDARNSEQRGIEIILNAKSKRTPAQGER